MKRVLVTGATGFVGRPAVAALQSRGFEVHALSRRPAPGGAVGHPADLLADPEGAAAVLAETRPTHLLHLAWITAPGVFPDSPENLAWIAASLALATRFAEAGGRRLVVAGSCAEYDPASGLCFESGSPLEPATLYGRCKRALHLALEGWAPAAGVGLAWARLFHPYGPGERPGRLVPSVVTALLRGEPAECTDGRQVRDFLHVGDAAEALAALVDSGVEGPVNIASGKGTSVADLVGRIASRLDAAALVRLGALPRPPGDPDRLVGDSRRLREEVGWSPRYDLDAGLADTIDWWRRAGARA